MHPMPTDPKRDRQFVEEEFLDLPEAHGSEELESEVRRARAELEELRRKQDQIEKEKQRLEELSRRQEALEDGKNEMMEKLGRALTSIHRETEEIQQRLEQLRVIQRNFSEHLAQLETIQPRSWSAAEAGRELTKGQAALDEARSEYNKASARLSIEAPESATAAELLEYEEEVGPKDFLYWLKSGFAFTLPLQVLALLGLLVWIWSLLSGN
jgi:predicted RNase H-like nuclease (RuvC/YqgF family)